MAKSWRSLPAPDPAYRLGRVRPPTVLVPLASFALLAACASRPPDVREASAAADATRVESAEEAAPPEPPRELGRFRMTYYLVAVEAEHRGSANTPLLGEDCRPITRVSKAFARELALEGTGRLRDGRLLNWAGRCPATKTRPRTPRYRVMDETRPWGIGVRDIPLVPFRSIASDPAVIATGTRVYVRELDGVTMPGDAPWGGFVHDGCVVAVDVGEAIRGAHIDFFSGTRQAYHALDGALRLRHVTLEEPGDRCAQLSAAAP